MTRSLPISKLCAGLLTCALLAGTSTSAFAAPPAAAAILHVPTAVVNGARVERSAVLFIGDRIRTGNSAASLELAGSAILIDKDSTAVLEDNQLALICGGAIVKTLKGMSARAGNLVMKPSGQSARFELVRTESSLRISALDGDLVVSNGSQSVILKKGRQMDLSCSKCVQDGTSIQNAVNADSGDGCVLQAATTPVPEGGASNAAYVAAGIAPLAAIWPAFGSSLKTQPIPISPSVP